MASFLLFKSAASTLKLARKKEPVQISLPMSAIRGGSCNQGRILQSGADPASELRGGGAISVIFGSQVS